MPASWLRARVAIAKPRAASSVTANQPRMNSRGRRPSVSASLRPVVATPATLAPTQAAPTPRTNVTVSPTATMTAIAANVRSM